MARIFKSVEGCCFVRLCVVLMVGHLIRETGCFSLKMVSSEMVRFSVGRNSMILTSICGL